MLLSRGMHRRQIYSKLTQKIFLKSVAQKPHNKNNLTQKSKCQWLYAPTECVFVEFYINIWF